MKTKVVLSWQNQKQKYRQEDDIPIDSRGIFKTAITNKTIERQIGPAFK